MMVSMCIGKSHVISDRCWESGEFERVGGVAGCDADGTAECATIYMFIYIIQIK